MQEIWKDIKGYEGLYQVSNLGRIKRLRFINKHTNKEKETFKETKIRKDGHLEVALWKEGKGKSWFVHRLVAIAFIPNPEKKMCVNHIDGNPKNNNVTNLGWATVSENTLHACRVLGKNTRKVEQYDPQGRYLATYASITIASEITGIRQCNISNALSGRRKTANRYIWKYVKEK